MRNIKYYLLSFTLFQLFGCQNNDIEFERIKVTINNQKFELATNFALFDDYLSHQNISDLTSASNSLIYHLGCKSINYHKL